MTRRTANVLLSVGAIVVTAALVEIMLRLVHPLEIHRYSDAIRVTSPVRVPLQQTIPSVKPAIVFSANQFGFRTLSVHSKKKPAGTVRIFCLGASTTLSEAQNTEDIWCALIEKKLKALGIDNVETAAFGRDGWRASHLLDWAVHNLLDYQPDIVVTLMGVNDLSFGGGPEWRPADIQAIVNRDLIPDAVRERCLARLPRAVCVAAASRLLVTAFETCAEWLQWCRLIAGAQPALNTQKTATLEWHSERLPVLHATLARAPFSSAPQRNPDPIDDFSAAMDELVQYLQARDVGVLLLGQPTLWRPALSQSEQAMLWFPVSSPAGWIRADPAWMEREMARYNVRQRDIASARGAAYLDLDGRIPKNLGFFFDDCHYTDAGNDKVASTIVPTLLELLRQRQIHVNGRTR